MNLNRLLLALTLLTTVFTVNAQNWDQIGSDINGVVDGDYAGYSVSLSADGFIVAVSSVGNNAGGGDAGTVRIYENIDGTWTQIGSNINGAAASDYFGNSVSLSADGSIVAIGAIRNDDGGSDSGHVRIYENISGNWIQIGSAIDGESSGDKSGQSVSLSADGSRIAIGASENSGPGAGYVRIYENQSNVWTKMGSNINGESSDDNSGYSVSLSSDGTTVVIGAYKNAGGGAEAGQARVYKYDGTAWLKIGSDIDGDAAGDWLGFSVSINSDGSIIAVGAHGNDVNGSRSGQVKIFQNISGAWAQIGSDINGEAAEDRSGSSVSLNSDGSIVAIGAYFNDGNGSDAGHVRVYQNQSGIWTQISSDINGEAAHDFSGFSTSISDDGFTVAIGAYGNGDKGQTRVYSYASYSTINEVACDNYTSPSGNYNWLTSGTYTDTIQSVIGADSIITINLTINPLSNSSIDNNICSNTNFIFADGTEHTNITSDETYISTLTGQATNGCDSIVTENIIVLPIATNTVNADVCSDGSYTYADGTEHINITSDETYISTLTGQAVYGCDSIVTENITVITVDVSVTENGITITANLSGGNYQWIDCNDNNSLISGETNSSFTATVNGSYAVIINDGICSDTSACIMVNSVDIHELNNSSNIIIYPNPSTGQITVESPNAVQVEIYNLSGVLIKSTNKKEIDLSQEAKGVYFVKIMTKENIEITKLIIE